MESESATTPVQKMTFVHAVTLRARTPQSANVRGPMVEPASAEEFEGRLLAVVTAADIEKARRDRSCGCAVQVALTRIFSRTALVAYDTMWREDGSRVLSARATVERRSWALPQHVVAFMRDFDQGVKVRPITFEIPEEDD